jgi:NADH-ubiquinone oxidoreductase chain 6
MLYNIFDLNELTIILDTYINGFNINIFNLLTFLAIISSILVIITNNPIISVLYLINLFLIISLILILHGLNFIGISYLLVYVGAVSMLFLFILMLIDIRISELHFESKNSLFLAFFISWLFYLFIGNVTPDYSKINTYKNISYISYNT